MSAKHYYCPVEVTVDLIGGKWKPMLLWQLSMKRQRFSDFQAALPQLAHKVLSQQLRQLEADGVIHRRAQDAVPARSEYELTDFGRSLRPALNALASWGKSHHRAMGVTYPAAGR